MNIEVCLPSLHANQKKIKSEARRFNVLSCGRRWGKTTLGIDLVVDAAVRGGTAAWFAPTYKYLVDVWEVLLETLGPLLVKVNSQQKRIKLRTGGLIECWSFDRDPRAGRSRRYHRIVFDEAAHADGLEEAWTQAVQPTLTDFGGDAWFLSSPRGPGFFKTIYDRGQAGVGAWKSWTQTSYDNPMLDPAVIDAAREELPDPVFRQEYLAEFFEASHLQLINAAWLDRCEMVERPSQSGGHRCMGVDLGEGTGRDWTVFVIRDDLGILHCEGSNRVGIPEAATRIKQLSEVWSVREDKVTYDAGGRGKDLPRYLEPYRMECVPYHGGAKAPGRFKNKRAAMAWRLRQRLDPDRPGVIKHAPRASSPWEADKPARVDLQPAFTLPQNQPWWPRMRAEIEGLRYEVDGMRVIALEGKEQMASRLGRSPDYLDALLMSFNTGE